MHVKEQVKELVHDVKRKFSKKHRRESCSTCASDNYDNSSYSSANTLGMADDASSSSGSSMLATSQRRRLISFLHPRTPSSPPNEHNVLHKVKRVGSKRHRLFSAPSTPSIRVADAYTSQSNHNRATPETESSINGSTGSIRDKRRMVGSSQEDFPDVIDISARSVNTDSVVAEESICDSLSQSQSQSHLDTEWGSETSRTLITAGSGDFKGSISDSDYRFDMPNVHSDENPAPHVRSPLAEESICYDSLSQHFDTEWGSETTVTSGDFKESISDSDSRFDVVNSHSDQTSASCVSPIPPIAPMAQDIEVPPVPPPKSEQVVITVTDADEEIALAQSTSSSPSSTVPSSSSPVVPQASRTITPAQPIISTPASPAPVYIPRLTAPSMFLPIPNTDPLSALLTKYVPAEQRPRRDVAGEYAGRDIHEMVMSNSWRALAKMARDRIVASDPEDLGRILDLWSLRLSSLARLRLTNQASAECTNLFAVLNAVHPTSTPGSFPGSGSLPPPISLPSSPGPAASLPLSPSGLSGLTQLPGTPSQKPSTLPPTLAGGSTAATAPNELLRPFELMVFHARVHYWSGDPLGYVDALSRILARCKERAREEGRVVVQRREFVKAGKSRGGGDVESTSQSEQTNGHDDNDEGEDEDKGEEDAEESTENAKVQEEEELDDVLVTAEANLSMWLERIARICLILASQMIEMNDYQAAINLLAPLCTHRPAPTFLPTPSPELHSALARVYLLSGNLQKAEEHFSIAASAAANTANGTDTIVTNTALLAVASGDWAHAEEALGEMVAKHPGNFTAINNLAVTLLCQGRIKEGIDLLEAAMNTSPSSVVVAEPFLFNLSTLYELRSTAAIDKKRELLVKVAKWSGDGLKTSCLKMPSS